MRVILLVAYFANLYSCERKQCINIEEERKNNDMFSLLINGDNKLSSRAKKCFTWHVSMFRAATMYRSCFSELADVNEDPGYKRNKA